MKIIVTAKGNLLESEIDERFGRANYLVVWDQESETLSSVDNSEVMNQAHGAGPETAKKVIDLNAGVLITGNSPGQNAGEILRRSDIKIFTGAGGMTVKEALNAYEKNDLKVYHLP